MQVGQKCNIEDMRRAKNTPPFSWQDLCIYQIYQIYILYENECLNILKWTNKGKTIYVPGQQQILTSILIISMKE